MLALQVASLYDAKIGGWGAELNREIVSCRACVRAVCMSSEFGVKIYGLPLSLFPFGLGRLSLFPIPCPPISYPASAGFIGILRLSELALVFAHLAAVFDCLDHDEP